MSSDNPLIWLPAGLAFVFLIIGLSASWRGILGLLIAGYAAIVIASQHNAFLSDVLINYTTLTNTTSRQQSAISFGVTFVALFFGILILYWIVWRPVSPNPSQQSENGWMKLLRGTLNAALGWVLGVILLICILTFQPLRLGSGTRAYTDAVYRTANAAIGLTEPWLVSGLPIVFRGE